MALLSQINGLAITQPSLEDLDAMLEIEKASFSVPWSRKAFETELLGNQFSVTLIARLESTNSAPMPIVAYICVWIVFEELRFLTLAVSPTVRRQKIGSQLVDRALRLGLVKGSKRALLEVRDSNLAAKALYEKFGFRHYGTRKTYYTNPDEDAILMSLDPLSIPDS